MVIDVCNGFEDAKLDLVFGPIVLLEGSVQPAKMQQFKRYNVPFDSDITSWPIGIGYFTSFLTSYVSSSMWVTE